MLLLQFTYILYCAILNNSFGFFSGGGILKSDISGTRGFAIFTSQKKILGTKVLIGGKI